MAEEKVTKTVARTRKKPDVEKTEEGFIQVWTSSHGAETEKREQIMVEKFAVDPAFVRVSAGRTYNLGQYESFRLDVAITWPCYKERVDEAQKFIAGKVAAMLDEEAAAYGLVPKDGA